jgi:hypothetical protein
VGLVSAVLGIVFVLWPNIKPESRPSEKKARLSQLVVVPNVSFEQYLKRIDQPRGGLTRDVLARRGAFIEFHATVIGFRGRKLPLKREVVDTTTGNEVGESRSTIITPYANSESFVWHDWALVPPRRHRYDVVLTLLQEDGIVPLDEIRGAVPRSTP